MAMKFAVTYRSVAFVRRFRLRDESQRWLHGLEAIQETLRRLLVRSA